MPPLGDPSGNGAPRKQRRAETPGQGPGPRRGNRWAEPTSTKGSIEMKGRKSLGFGLMVALAAMATMAFAASSASATEVVPAGKKIKATLVEDKESRFIPKNGYDELYIACDSASAEFSVPDGAAQPAGGMKQNQNNREIGTLSQGSGSVSAQIQDQPSFTDCDLRESAPSPPTQAKGTDIVEATVTTAEGWVIAWEQVTIIVDKKPVASIIQQVLSVPDAGATIEYELFGFTCVITIGEEQQTAVMGEYVNDTSMGSFDGQVKYTTNVSVQGVAGLSTPAA